MFKNENRHGRSSLNENDGSFSRAKKIKISKKGLSSSNDLHEFYIVVRDSCWKVLLLGNVFLSKTIL